MGDRYILQVECSKCGTIENEVCFAPTCGYDEWECSKCGHVTDLYKFTGLTYADCSNASVISDIIDGMTKK